MKIKWLFFMFSLVAVSFSSFGKKELKEAEKQRILDLLEQQADAWNEGNLERLMETYWKSEQLAFVGGKGPIFGWDATLERYKKTYPNKQAMGHVEFKVFRIQQIDRKTVFLIGRYELTREIGDATGHFTLVIQRFGGDWKIVSDHSSAAN